MNFEVIINNPTTHPEINLVDTATGTAAQVFCFGGLLNKFSIHTKQGSIQVIDAYDSTAHAIAQKNTWFKSCKLSPFVCRLQQGQYAFNGKAYAIEKFYLGKHALHGIVYDAVYKIIDWGKNPNAAWVELQHNYMGSDAGYPFTYNINLRYTLEKQNKLTLQTTVQHNNATPIPYADGWHPYFKLDAPINACTLQFDATNLLEFDDDLLPTGTMVLDDRFIKPMNLNTVQLDNCYLLSQPNPQCVLESHNLQLKIMPDASYPYLQVFIPDHRQNIAIENLSAAPNAFNNRMGLLLLQPNISYNFFTSFILSEK